MTTFSSFVPSSYLADWKIQGCRCDGGFTGPDCSQRLCPLGDDPLTVPSPSPAPLPGQVWEFQLSASATTTTEDSYFFFEVVDLYGVTARSRTIRIPSTWFLTSGNNFPVPPYSTASSTFDESAFIVLLRPCLCASSPCLPNAQRSQIIACLVFEVSRVCSVCVCLCFL